MAPRGPPLSSRQAMLHRTHVWHAKAGLLARGLACQISVIEITARQRAERTVKTMAYVSLPVAGRPSSGFFARVAALLSALNAANARVGYGEPFGL